MCANNSVNTDRFFAGAPKTAGYAGRWAAAPTGTTRWRAVREAHQE